MLALFLVGGAVIAGFIRAFIQFLRSVDPKPAGTGFPRCPMCSFDVRGLQKFECPECGSDLMQVGIIGACPPADTKQILDRGIAGALLLTIGVLIVSVLFFLAVQEPGWHILIPPVLAAAVMAFFIWRGHSRRAAELRQRLEEAMKTREARRAARAQQDVTAAAVIHHPPH